MKAGVVIDGGKELDANLATLGQRLHRKVIRQAVRAGQRPMLTQARANARAMVGGRMGGAIAKALQIRAPRRQKAGRYTLQVQLKSGIETFFWPSGPNAEGTQSDKRQFIPAAIEYGHMAGGVFVPAIPFGRGAAEATQGQTLQRFTAELRKGLLREAIKGRYK